jgi:hypothetical protein
MRTKALADKIADLPDNERSLLWDCLRDKFCMTCGSEDTSGYCCFSTPLGDDD